MIRIFGFSLIFSAICLIMAFLWSGVSGMFTVLMLSILEISLSFDNAVVNAAVMRGWNHFWRNLFLTVGIFVAVFGMRLYFPLEIVSTATGMSLFDVAKLALDDPDQYATMLMANNASVAAFGGVFLLLVFLNFLFNPEKEHHWLGAMEARLADLGKINAFTVLISLLVLILASDFLLVGTEQSQAIKAGVWGIILYLLVKSLGDFFEGKGGDATSVVSQGSIMGFLYLELLDASFSFDGVIGAFAISRDVIIIMLGLGIGAIFVRSITIYLLEKGTLDQYIYLEHGAHYAIGALALIMFISMKHHVPEVITGLIGVGFIVAAIYSSILVKRRHGPA